MECNVWKFQWCRWIYYLHHPIKWFEDLFLSIKRAWQRSVRGYADCDWFNMCDWIIAVLAPMFEDYAKHHYGYPGEAAGFTDEQWTQYLYEIARHLRNASEDQEVQINEYEESWDQMSVIRCESIKTWEDEAGCRHDAWPELTEEQKEIRDKYFARAQEIYEWREQEAKTALKMIGDQFFSLWD